MKTLRELEQDLRDLKAAYDQLEDKGELSRDGHYVRCFSSDAICLVGMVTRVLTPTTAESGLGITYGQRMALEAGFCGWKAFEHMKEHPREYRLGDKLAREWCPTEVES